MELLLSFWHFEPFFIFATYTTKHPVFCWAETKTETETKTKTKTKTKTETDSIAVSNFTLSFRRTVFLYFCKLNLSSNCSHQFFRVFLRLTFSSLAFAVESTQAAFCPQNDCRANKAQGGKKAPLFAYSFACRQHFCSFSILTCSICLTP